MIGYTTGKTGATIGYYISDWNNDDPLLQLTDEEAKARRDAINNLHAEGKSLGLPNTDGYL